jgi:hypothetical protein
MRSPADIIEALRREAQENNQGDLMIAAADEIDGLCSLVDGLAGMHATNLELRAALAEALDAFEAFAAATGTFYPPIIAELRAKHMEGK